MRNRNKIIKSTLTKYFLITKYIKNKKSILQIAHELGNCNYVTVYNYLKNYKIKIRPLSESTKGNRNGFFGKHHTETQKEKWSKTRKGIKLSIKTREAMSKASKGKKKSLETKKKMKVGALKRWKNNFIEKKRLSNWNKLRWSNLKYKEKVLKKMFETRKIKPNKPEKFLNKLIGKLFPKEYKFVGDGKIWFDHFNPDFININGQKKIIEMYGDYWHNREEMIERDNRRIKTYKKYGYKTLIIWDYELKNLKILKEKIKEFHDGSI